MHDDATLASERFFPLPPAQVYAAFADPARLDRWWGPRGFRTVTNAFELRPGGVWRLTMTGPDGARIPMEKRFAAVVPARRVVMEHHQAGHTFTLEMRYEEVPGGTRLTWTTTFAGAAQLAAVREAFVRGNEENFDRLELELERGA